jgi:hypothetical protein
MMFASQHGGCPSTQGGTLLISQDDQALTDDVAVTTGNHGCTCFVYGRNQAGCCSTEPAALS